MAIPKIPPILTEAEWNKNKGTFAKMAGETGIGRLMAAVKLFYDEVKWSAFDVQQALRATDTAEQIDGQLKLAEAEFQKVTPLVKKLKELEVQATLTQQKFSKSLVIPKASAVYVGKVAAGAKMFSGQVQMVKAEYDAFKKAAASKRAAAVSKAKALPSKAKPLPPIPTATKIENVAKDLFAKLNDLGWNKEPDVLKWSKSTDAILLPLDKEPNDTLKEDQKRLTLAIKDFELHKKNLETLKNHQINKIEIENLKKEVTTIEKTLKVALNSFEDYDKHIEEVISKSDKNTIHNWSHEHHDVIELTDHVKEILKKEETDLNEFIKSYQGTAAKLNNVAINTLKTT